MRGALEAHFRGSYKKSYLNHGAPYAVLPCMAEPKEKNRSKDIVLWIITVVLIAVAIYWYKK